MPKHEVVGGVEVLRLIMDLRPANLLFEPLQGDLATLPLLSQMAPLEVREGEHVLISSEDIKAMFYVVGLPEVWRPFLCFNKVIPASLNPAGDRRPHVLSATVLPMGFINSVSIAQHLHQGLVTRAMELAGVGRETELRRDKAVPRSPLFYRVYLENFDTLQKVNPSAAALLEGRPNGASLALRSAYEEFNVPRNVKKTVEQQLVAEMQGVLFDGG